MRRGTEWCDGWIANWADVTDPCWLDKVCGHMRRPVATIGQLNLQLKQATFLQKRGISAQLIP